MLEALKHLYSMFRSNSEQYRTVHINPFNVHNYAKYTKDSTPIIVSKKQVYKLNPYSKNTVKNTKYTFWNVIFLLCYEQFSLHMTQYFILIGVRSITGDYTNLIVPTIVG
jgi:hypothetical protein